MLEVYLDDTLAAGTDEFLKITDKIPEEFESEPREFPKLLFSGVMINTHRLGYFLEQNAYSNKLDKLPSDCDFNLFRKTRHRLPWITRNPRGS